MSKGKNFLSDLWARATRALEYRPEHPSMLHPQPPASAKNVPVDRIKAYRSPSPGSITGAKVPLRSGGPGPEYSEATAKNDVYDIKHYTRDYRNVTPDSEVLLNSKKQVLFAPNTVQGVIRVGAPGNKNPAVLAYDPTGLRSTMSASWAEMDKSLKLRATSNHLPAPEWFETMAAVEKDREDRGLPAPLGRPTPLHVSKNYNQVKW